ncbi:hypothetical protein AB8880_10550 [Alphaproteobacteria bacterium LSUCC0684]
MLLPKWIINIAEKYSCSYLMNRISVLLMALLFFNLIVFSENNDWQEKYIDLAVPAFSYPGGDSRNIQIASYCKATTISQESFNICYLDAIPVTSIHEGALVPPYNYPKIWISIYGFFNDYSEKFFINFWRVNATLFVFTLILFSLRISPILFSISAFSPISLLAIERGNVDAMVFAVCYLPILLGLKSQFIKSFILFWASGLKIFPIFALPVLLMEPFRAKWRLSIAGFLCASPLLVLSLMDLMQIASNTTNGFAYAYGLFSIFNAPFFENNITLSVIALLTYSAIIVIWVKFSLNRKIYNPIVDKLSKEPAWKLFLFYTSVFIFILTFIFFINWSYRLIFLIPALFILSTFSCVISKVILLNIVFILWMPYLPLGWGLQNLFCYLLFLLFSPMFFMQTFKLSSMAWIKR